MSYYFSKILPLTFEDGVRHTIEALKSEGFGIITEIDLKDTFRKKLGIEFRNYRILGACNPKLAYEALQLENKVGTMLPCNVVVQKTDNGTEIAAIDPCVYRLFDSCAAVMQSTKKITQAAKRQSPRRCGGAHHNLIKSLRNRTG